MVDALALSADVALDDTFAGLRKTRSGSLGYEARDQKQLMSHGFKFSRDLIALLMYAAPLALTAQTTRKLSKQDRT
jgi:hypothetical protein